MSESEYPGWWSKVPVFGRNERTIFLDLDTVIVGNVDFLLEYDGRFAILQEFGNPRGYGSAIFAYEPGFGANIKAEFEKDPAYVMTNFYGDQDWIRHCHQGGQDYWQTMHPGKIKSYKYDEIRSGEWYPDLRIVCFHGAPQPHDAMHHEFMQEHWR
jgi:hypothetical protein